MPLGRPWELLLAPWAPLAVVARGEGAGSADDRVPGVSNDEDEPSLVLLVEPQPFLGEATVDRERGDALYGSGIHSSPRSKPAVGGA